MLDDARQNETAKAPWAPNNENFYVRSLGVFDALAARSQCAVDAWGRLGASD